MFGEIFHLNCIECGAECGTSLPVCPECLKSIKKHPHRCENCGYPVKIPAKTCGKCLTDRYWDKITIEYPYEMTVKKLLKQIKFHYRITGSRSLGLLITPPKRQYDLIIPVPSHYTRRLRRYIHPAESIAQAISAASGASLSKVLIRNRKTEYQYKLRSHMRQKNVRNAFSCKKDITGLKILLVDDIITTGATVSECCRVLRQAGASVIDVYALAGGVR